MELREVFEPLISFLKNLQKKNKDTDSRDTAKERLQLVLMQDRASVSPDFFEMMKKEIIDVIKKYIEIDEESLEVQLTRGFEEGDGTGPALYANIPIKNIKPVAKKVEESEDEELVTEVINNEEIEQIAEEDVAKEEVVAKANIEMEAAEENIETKENNIETKAKDVTESVEKVKADVSNKPEKVETAEITETTEASENTQEELKDKIAEVKEGVAETIEKVKKGAKEGIKKIKTKTQKKKVKEE